MHERLIGSLAKTFLEDKGIALLGVDEGSPVNFVFQYLQQRDHK